MEDRLAGTLLGTALADALGLPAEGMSPASIARRFGDVDRFHLLGPIGFVSDDTEQSALIADSLVRHPDDPAACARAFRRQIAGFVLRLPFGIGLATLRAGFRAAVGMSRSGVRSAGNGAAMRAAIVGVTFAEDGAKRDAFGRALAEVTHTDPRGVEGALFVAETAAALARDASPAAAAAAARPLVQAADLAQALDRALALAQSGASTSDAARELRTTGFVVHTVPFAVFCLLRHAEGPPFLPAQEAIRAGGDTDTIGAIVGAWSGARHGAAALPAHLIDRIQDGPFGPSHLRALAHALDAVRRGERPQPPRWSATVSLVRNLALYPVILGHGFRRLIPF